MIESFNNLIKRKAKPKAEIPTERSLNTFIGIQTNAISIESTKALVRFRIP